MGSLSSLSSLMTGSMGACTSDPDFCNCGAVVVIDEFLLEDWNLGMAAGDAVLDDRVCALDDPFSLCAEPSC